MPGSFQRRVVLAPHLEPDLLETASLQDKQQQRQNALPTRHVSKAKSYSYSTRIECEARTFYQLAVRQDCLATVIYGMGITYSGRRFVGCMSRHLIYLCYRLY